jgi:hypothetical protein
MKIFEGSGISWKPSTDIIICNSNKENKYWQILQAIMKLRSKRTQHLISVHFKVPMGSNPSEDCVTVSLSSQAYNFNASKDFRHHLHHNFLNE